MGFIDPVVISTLLNELEFMLLLVSLIIFVTMTNGSTKCATEKLMALIDVKKCFIFLALPLKYYNFHKNKEIFHLAKYLIMYLMMIIF